MQADSDIRTLADLNDKRISVQISTKPEELLLTHQVPGVEQVKNVYSLANVNDVFAALDKGYVDACAGHETAYRSFMSGRAGQYRVLDQELLRVGLGVAFYKGDDTGRAEALSDVLRELKEGAAVYARDRKLCFMTACITIGLVFFLPLSSFYPLMTSDYFQGTAWQGSLVELLYAAGMMLSALLTGMLGRMQNKLAWVHLGLLGIGATSLLCGLLPPTAFGYWAFAVLCMLMGASGNLYGIPYTAYLQETIPPELQGRAFSLMGSVMSFAMPIGLLISGPVAEAYGVPLWCALTGAVFLLTTAVSWWYVKRRQTAGS